MIRNLTPHTVHLVTPAGPVLLPSDGSPARIRQRATLACRVTVDSNDASGVEVDLFNIHDGEVDGLPAPRSGVYLVVPRVIAYACPERHDLVFPYHEVRDETGCVVGCAALGRTAREGDLDGVDEFSRERGR